MPPILTMPVATNSLTTSRAPLTHAANHSASRSEASEEVKGKKRRHDGSVRSNTYGAPSIAGSPILGPTMPDSKQPKQPRSALARASSLPTITAIDSESRGKLESRKFDMCMSFIKDAFKLKSEGKSSKYDELVAQFRISGSSGSAPTQQQLSGLPAWLRGLTHHVPDLDRSYSSLVDAILTLPWATMSDNFVEVWKHFVFALVSARTEWISAVLHRVVKGLTYRSDWRALSFAISGTSSSATDGQDNTTVLTRRLIAARTHAVLERLIELVPTLPSTLANLIVRNFPHKRESRNTQVVYVRNILQVCKYCEDLEDTVLGAVTDRAVQIDVEIQVELEDMDPDEGGDPFGFDATDPFDNPLGDSDSDSDNEDDGDLDNANIGALDELSSNDSDGDVDLDGIGTGVEPTDKEAATARARVLVEKLDGIMLACFEYLSDAVRKDGNADLAASTPTRTSRPPVWTDQRRFSQRTILLNLYLRTVLPTFRVRHVQFLAFWYSAKDSDFADMLLGSLIQRALLGTSDADIDKSGDESVEMQQLRDSAHLRVAAASHVASLVARATHMQGDVVRAVMRNLCAFLDGHYDDHQRFVAASIAAGQSGASINPASLAAPEGSSAHHVWYAVIQAVMYLFCFRWRDLQLDSEGEAEDANDSIGLNVSLSSLTAGRWDPCLSTLPSLLMSKLNPLRHCSPTVVKQFATVASQTDFCFCWSKIQSNNRRGGAGVLNGGGSGSGAATPTRSTDSPIARSSLQQQRVDPTPLPSQLDDFFPFDPYPLALSGRFVEPYYRFWKDIAVEQSDEEEEDEDEDKGSQTESDDDDDEENDETGDSSDEEPRKAKQLPIKTTGKDGATKDDERSSPDVAHSFEAMSISPNPAWPRV